jgi:GNAT superfamily N-acetyltransferase
MRIAALTDAPYTFSSTLAGALERSDDVWADLVNKYASDPNSITCFAFLDDVPCGMAACALIGEETEMFAVWVDPEYRRKGIGQGLIAYALKWSQARGAQKMTVGVYR